jgi:hypothetical protein
MLIGRKVYKTYVRFFEEGLLTFLVALSLVCLGGSRKEVCLWQRSRSGTRSETLVESDWAPLDSTIA